MKERKSCPKCNRLFLTEDNYCQECGTKLEICNETEQNPKNIIKEETTVVNVLCRNFIKPIFELITFVVTAIIISVVFIIPIVKGTTIICSNISADNILQQMSSMLEWTLILISIGVGLVLGFMVAFVIRNTVQLNNLEKKLNNIQENIKKEI